MSDRAVRRRIDGGRSGAHRVSVRQLVELARLVDPINWPWRVVLGALLAIVFGPLALEWLGLVDIPHWLALPAAGTVAWRAQRRRYRDIATWVVPLAVIDIVAFELTAAQMIPFEAFTAVYVLLVAWAFAMVFSERVQNAWLSVAAPGHYRSMPDADRALNHALRDLDIDMWEAQERLAKTQDLAAFQRRSAAAREKALAIPVKDPDWERVRELWLRYLDWWDERDEPPDDEAAYEDLDARRAAYVEAIERLRDIRSRPLGPLRPAAR